MGHEDDANFDQAAGCTLCCPGISQLGHHLVFRSCGGPVHSASADARHGCPRGRERTRPGLATPGRHDLHPGGRFGPSLLSQVFQSPYVVHLNLGAAKLAGIGQQALDKLCPTLSIGGVLSTRVALVSRAREIPPQYATSGFWPGRAFSTISLTRALVRLDRGPVSLEHLGSADFQLACKRLGEGQFHDPA